MDGEDRILTAGTARVMITPPVGIHLVGFAGRLPSTGVHAAVKVTLEQAQAIAMRIVSAP